MTTSIRLIAKRLAPNSILRIRQNILRMRQNLFWSQIRQQYGKLSVREAFDKTYRTKLWGEIEGEEFFSGPGSLEEFAAPYTSWLTQFIAERNINTIVDLGCGDFRVGRRICAANSVNYVGVDIVPDLIAYNQSQFGSENISFKCANIIEDELPNGDLCLIRQVFQHLSNKQISRVLTSCSKFTYLLVTEHVYSGPNMRPNLDIMHGPDNRLHKHSGVLLNHAPFNMKTQTVIELPCHQTDSMIQTHLVDRAASSARERPKSGASSARHHT